MNDISLNASMRSNLLSLQQISKLQDRTQLRLSTGLKVNSATDNPSSYYTATALNNRADDLSALLDAMGQGVQTIKAANEGLEKAEDLISQMKAIAEQVNTSSSYVPDKSYFIKEVGTNGAVVSTADELRDAVNSGKETICVYGKIDLGDISTTGGLSLQENQKLVGVNYFGNYKDGIKISSISATDSVSGHALIDITKTGCLVSDLSLNYENNVTTGNAFAIKSDGSGVVTNLQNLDIVAKFSDDDSNVHGRAAISLWNGAVTNIENDINIEVYGAIGCGILTHTNSTTNILKVTNIHIKTYGSSGYGISTNSQSLCSIQSNANINIETSGRSSYGICIRDFATCDIFSNACINIKTTGENGYGILAISNSKNNILSGANVKIQTSGQSGHGIFTQTNSISNLNGNISITSLKNDSYGIVNSVTSGNQTYISSSAQIYLNTAAQGFYNGKNNNILEIAQGAKIAFEKNGSTKWYEVKEDYRDENKSTSVTNYITADTFDTIVNADATSSWQTAKDIIEEKNKDLDYILSDSDVKAYQKQFNSALSQYDMLINDSIYKGINLLKEDKLKVNFNEDKSANVLVQGVDVTSKSLGLLSADWQTGKDVAESLSQVLSVRDKLRSAASQLGNYYSIITERQTFTENLINVLTEGADKLTLADMNEESANMLSLQTQQNLAVNSLSLASQASQAVLRLF